MGPITPSNAIYHAHTPHFDHWWQTAPHALVETSGLHVGLPQEQMGNSEVGHLNLGAGRIVYQDLTRIHLALRAPSSAQKNPALLQAIHQAKAAQGALHLMGLLSPGGVHSHSDHFLAIVRAAAEEGMERIFIHAFLDGRDTPPRSALAYLTAFQDGLKHLGAGRLSSLCGRYYAMDRDKRWERVQRAYDMLVLGREAKNVLTADHFQQALEQAYQRGEDDEFVQPTLLLDQGEPVGVVQEGDAIFMMNFRADRIRQLSHAFQDPPISDTDSMAFTGFHRTKRPQTSAFVTMTQYDKTLPNVLVAFPPEPLTNILSAVLSAHGLRQLRAAETEKYAHVTYFFNGGQETPFAGENRLLIPSSQVATYDLHPQMSAIELTQRVMDALHSEKPDFLVVNYANPDMVGHTGQFSATVTAIETVDRCLGELVHALLALGGEVLITADHGNAEQMQDPHSGQAHTAHTNNPAPLIHLGSPSHLKNGRLCDIAPTLLKLLGIPQPIEMTGESLVSFPSF
ncbi:MAG: 2,3-bisphosphoglycerate-independent phosphoglycerate mutase [Magnetococcus sp. DMHC-6]